MSTPAPSNPAPDEASTTRTPVLSGRTRLVVLATLTLVAVLAAAASGVFWLRARADPDLRAAQQRDVVLETGKHHLTEINTLDFHEPDAGLTRWQRQVTGPLAEEIKKSREDNVRSIRDAKTVTKAKVLDASVTKLDSAKGQANVIAALEVTVTPEGGEPVTKRSRVDSGLTRTGDGWKLSSVQVVGLSG